MTTSRAPAQLIIDATDEAFVGGEIAVGPILTHRSDRAEFFVESTPGAGESFEVKIDARPRDDAAWQEVASGSVSDASPEAQNTVIAVSTLGREIRVRVTPGGAEPDFTGKVFMTRVD